MSPYSLYLLSFSSSSMAWVGGGAWVRRHVWPSAVQRGNVLSVPQNGLACNQDASFPYGCCFITGFGQQTDFS